MENISALFDETYMDEEATAATLALADENIKRTVKLVFCTIYVCLFIIGVVGNGYVIIMLMNIFSLLNSKKVSAAQRLSAFGTTHMFIYVLGLSIVDFLVIMHLPLLVFEIIEGQWIFGTALCKLYWIGESANKLLSSFLMTVLSWDRFMAVCSPIRSIRFRNNRVALIVLFSCASFAILLLYPVLINSNVNVVHQPTGLPIEELKIRFPEIQIEKHEIITKCAFEPTDPVFFMFYTFFVGFIVPALLISYFYLRVVLRLRASTNNIRKHSNSDSFTTSNSMARLHKVTHRVVAIVLFYFICWSPYWALNISLNFQILITSLPQITITTLFFSAHILVCFNSAANPLLYALINRELRSQHNQALMKRRRSVHLQAHRIQSDKPSVIRDSPTDYFIPQRRHHSYHQSRHSESSLDSSVFAMIAERCRASLPQTKLSKSLMGLRTIMTNFGGRTPPASKRNSIKRDIRSNSFSQPSFSTAQTQLTNLPKDESSSFVENNLSAHSSAPNSAGLINTETDFTQIKIFIQEYD